MYVLLTTGDGPAVAEVHAAVASYVGVAFAVAASSAVGSAAEPPFVEP